MSERERCFKVNLRCVDNNRCSASAHITQLQFYLIIFFSRSFLELGRGRRVAFTMLLTAQLTKQVPYNIIKIYSRYLHYIKFIIN